MKRFMSVCPIVLAFGLIMSSAGVVSAQRTNRQQLQKAAAQAQAQAKQQADAINAEKKKTANDATAAENKVSGTQKTMAELNESIRKAKADVDEATKALTAVETEVADAQPADSDFGKARDAYRAADKTYLDARKAALGTPEFKEKLEQARAATESGPALLALRKETLDDNPAVQEPLGKMKEAKETYEPLKKSLFEGDSKWTAANQDLKDKKKALDDLNHEFAQATAAERAALAEKRKAEAAAKKAASATTSAPVRNYGRKRR